MFDLCIDARMAFSSGIGTYIREIVPHLKESFRLILLVDELDRSWCNGIEQMLFNAPIYSLKEQLLFPFKVPSCDLFWSPHYNVPLLPIRAKKRIVTIHDVCHLVFGGALQKAYARVMIGKALKSDRVITVSKFSKQEIEKFFGSAEIEVVPIGVNLERYYPRKIFDSVKKKYQLPEKFALFVGSKKPHKNLERLQNALSKTNLQLVAVGKDLQEVDQEDLPILYSLAEVFVFPSLYEGFGLPPLEAMGCGCPTAVSNVASIPEVCGDASVYFDPTNEEEMAAAIKRASILKKELIAKGLERVKNFNWKKVVGQHSQLFEEALHA